jgi:diacylglycerol kinase family enzyme
MGIFPKLITEMKKGDEIEDPAEKLKHTLKVLQKILGEYEAEKFEITVDKNKLSGSYLMVEVMNINYVGPNLKLAPDADPGDGLLDVVLVPGENRVKLLQYLDEMSKGKVEDTNVYEFVKIYRAKEVTIKYQGKNVHLDDDFIENYSGEEIHLQAASGGLKFFSDK